MLVQLREVEQLLTEAILPRLALLELQLQLVVLGCHCCQLVLQVADAVVGGLLVSMAGVVALLAAEDDGGAGVLVPEEVVVAADFLAALLSVHTLEADLAQQVTRDAVDLVELGVAAAEGAVVRVLLEPLGLAVGADWLLAHFAL